MSATADFASALDLSRLTVHSRQGQVLRAEASMSALPGENITTGCLALGTAADAPDAEFPVLEHATLSLDPSGRSIGIRGTAPIHSPGLEIVLRVQCAGAPVVVRNFRVLIPPPDKALARFPPAKRRGHYLRIAPGETLEDIARLLVPKDDGLRESLIRQTVAGNPAVFPDGNVGKVTAGSTLWFPDLRDVSRRKLPAAPPGSTGTKASLIKPGPVRSTRAPPDGERQSGEPTHRRRTLNPGEKPGLAECRTLASLCGFEPLFRVGPPQNLSLGNHSGAATPRLKHEGFDAQMRSLEHSLAKLSISPAPILPRRDPELPVPANRPASPQVAPLPWVNWLMAILITLVAAVAGYGLGRRKGQPDRRRSSALLPVDAELNRMFTSAADAMRDFENTRDPTRAGRRRSDASTRLAAQAVTPVIAAQDAIDPRATLPSTSSISPAADGPTLGESPETETAIQASNTPRDEHAISVSRDANLSAEESFEIDQAMDDTGALLGDVDRFIATGDYQNAITLLQYRIQQEPLNRTAWIKLLGVYRKGKMDADLDATIRAFRNYFPRNITSV